METQQGDKMSNKPTAEELEEYLVPREAMQLFLDRAAEGVPTSIACHPEYGWYVLQNSEQGSYIIWSEEK